MDCYQVSEKPEFFGKKKMPELRKVSRKLRRLFFKIWDLMKINEKSWGFFFCTKNAYAHRVPKWNYCRTTSVLEAAVNNIDVNLMTS